MFIVLTCLACYDIFWIDDAYNTQEESNYTQCPGFQIGLFRRQQTVPNSHRTLSLHQCMLVGPLIRDPASTLDVVKNQFALAFCRKDQVVKPPSCCARLGRF